MTHHSLKLKTMIKISNAQEPANPDADTKERNQLDCARSLIKMGLAFKNPEMVQRGRRMKRQVIKARFSRLFNIDLTSQDAALLIGRRNEFVAEIEKRNNELSI